MSNNIKIICCDSTISYKNKYKEFFKNSDIVDLKLKDILNNGKNDIKSDNPLFEEFMIFSYLYNNSGLFLKGDFEFIKSINSFLENDFFIGFSDYSNLACNIIWVKERNNETIKKVLELIKTEKYNNITDVFSAITKKDLHNNYNYVLKFYDNSYIYPYDFFYPIDYERIGKGFTDNLKAIYYDSEKKLTSKQKYKINTLKKIGPTACEYFFEISRRVKNNVGYKKYITVQKIKNKFSVKKDFGIEETMKVLDNYIERKNNGEQIEYIIIHNPRWLGVTSATKELFTNLLPMQEIFLNSNIDKIVDKIVEIGTKQVIFSAFNYGWDKIARKLKEKNKDIKLKSFWHGSHSQVIEEINWQTNLMVINLHKEHVIDVMGTCKESLVNFYKSQGYKTAFIKNTVRLSDEVKEAISKVKKEDDGKLKFGLYSAGTDWRKNTFNQVMAASYFDNAQLEVVPLRYELKKLAYYNNLEIVGSDSHLKREDLLLRMAQRDIVLYVTFSECAPMLPIESLEAGTICIMGHSHHYFKNSKLHDYLVVEREDDVISICEKIENALKNKDEIFKLYREWKKQNDEESKISVEEFLKM